MTTQDLSKVGLLILLYLAFVVGNGMARAMREADVGRTLMTESSEKANQGRRQLIKYEWRILVYMACLIAIIGAALWIT
jgi:hypothetical protein